MARKTSQRIVYLVTAAIVVSMIGGFALATFQLNGQTNNSYQGSQTTNVTPLPGLTWLATNITAVPSSLTYNTCGTTAGLACDVATNPATVCVGNYDGSPCAAGDFVEQITLTTSTGTFFYGVGPTASVTLTTYVTGTPVSGPDAGTQGTYAGPAVYFTEAASPVQVTIVLDFDVGLVAAGPGAVTSVSVIATG